MADLKISLPSFLKLLTSNDISVPRAMALAGKIYKECNTSAKVAQVTDARLKSLGIDDKEDRKLILAAFRKAGYERNDGRRKANASQTPTQDDTSRLHTGQSSSSPPSAMLAVITPTKKRKRDGDINELLPDGPADEAATYGSLEFNEVLDEEVLRSKSTVVNRAPLMTAWATVVSERLGFQREEALSIATVYTEMNAISKGVSLGIYDKGKGKDLEASRGGAQPYVELMGRSPLFQTQLSQWRALSSEKSPAPPSAAFSYISRAFRQTTPHVMGALRLLAESYAPQDVNERGWGLYADFRPDVQGWGARGEVRCEKILGLRKPAPLPSVKNDAGGKTTGGSGVDDVVKFEQPDDKPNFDEPADHKKSRLTLEDVTIDAYNI